MPFKPIDPGMIEQGTFRARPDSPLPEGFISLPTLVQEKKGFVSKVKDSFNKRMSNLGDTMVRGADGQQTPVETGVQVVGQGAGFVGDLIGNTISSIIPEKVKEGWKQDFEKSMEDPTFRAGVEKLGGLVTRYQKFEEENPRAAANVAAIGNIASMIPTGKGAKVAAEGVEDIAVAGAKTAAKVAEEAVETTKSVVSKASDIVTPIESGVKTVLKAGKNEMKPADKLSALGTVKDKFNKYVEQAQKAVEDYSQGTPLELAGKEGEVALQKIQNQMEGAGKAIQNSLTRRGPKTVEITDTNKLFVELLDSKLGTQLGSTDDILEGIASKAIGESSKKGAFMDAAGRKSLISKSPSDTKLVKMIKDTLDDLGDTPTLQEVNDAVDAIQGQLYKSRALGAEPLNSRTESVVKEVIGDLNERAKVVGGKAYRSANEQYSGLREVFDDLNKGLGVDANKGAALMKQLFSPSGTMPRKLFARVKELTGIDLVQEATLAKFAMENIGDVRQASLLEQVLRGQGLKESLIKKAIDKIQDPIGKAKRTVEKEIKNEGKKLKK